VSDISLLESSVANLLVKESERSFLVVVESVLLAVSHAVEEFGVFTSTNVAILIQVSNSEDLFHSNLAARNIDLGSDQRKNTTVV